MFNNSSNIDASHSVFSEVHQNQYYNARSTVLGNQTINTVVQGNQIIQDSRTSLIESLHKASAPSAAHDSAQRYPAPKCIEGTRIELLARITSWLDEPGQKPICWLNGRPGSGKSAVSQTVAEKYAAEKRLAASFFFSRRDLERRTTQHVVPTLTTQLLDFLPSIRPAVIAALEIDFMIPMKVLREQMEKLLLDPLSTAVETPDSPILMVIDALDECDDESLVTELVSLLARLPSKTSLPLRILITSRAEPWLQSLFHRPDTSVLTLPLDIHSFTAEDDIRSFLRHALDDTYDQHIQVMRDVPRPWPSSDDLERIVNKAGGLFIFALTVVKFVGDKTHNPILRLQAILEDTAAESGGSAYGDLDALYRDAISTFPDPDVARLVLGLVYCITIPMSISGLHKLLQRPDVDVRLVIPALSSVLLASEDGRQPVQFYHASFRDFLINPQRARKYTVNPDVYHRFMAQLCLETMSNSLKRDMCGIGDPAKANREVPDLAERRKNVFDESLSYACRFWSHHLVRLTSESVVNEALLGTLKTFSTSVLLFWIEALSIFGDLENAVVMLRECMSWLKTLRQVPNDLLALIGQAEYLVVLFMDPISECALHVYVTAISFIRQDGALYKTFKHQSYGTLIRYPGWDDDWTSLRRDLKFFNPIHYITFSPNGDLIAIAGVNQGVQVWNAITGGNVASLGDISSTSLLVRFSRSGAFLAAAFEDGTVVVWDPKVGREVMKHEDCHKERITCIEFSNDNVLLASGSRDHQIQIWSMQTALPLYRLTTHEGPVTSLIFSSDSRRLLSGATDNLVIIWDMSTGRVIRGMMGHRKAVNCVAVSDDGRIAASGSEDKTIKIWDTTSGKCTRTYSKGHSTGIRFVHFFDEDKYIATACDEAILTRKIASSNTSETIWTVDRLYKAVLKRFPAWQGRVIGWGLPSSVLRGLIHLGREDSEEATSQHLTAAFATHSPTFIFTSQGSPFPMSLLEPTIDFPLGDFETTVSVALSPDGNLAAAAGGTGSLQIFDLTVPRKSWEDAEITVKKYPLSDGGLLVSSHDGTRFVVHGLMKWYLADANQHIIKKIDLGAIGSMRDSTKVKFSAKGGIFFCLILHLLNDEKTTLRVFDSVTGEQLMVFPGLKQVNSSVASPDGAWVACGDRVGQLDLFNIASKERTRIGEANTSPINVLLFSDNAQELLGGCDSGVVHIWDRTSGDRKAAFEASTSKVTALAYASMPGIGARVAIGREDGSLSLWSPPTSVSHDILRGDQVMVKNVDFIQFSEDRSRLTSRGEDGSIFEWAIPFDASDVVDMAQCSLCERHEPEGKAASESETTTLPIPHLLSRSDPEDVVDSLFHTNYRVRKDGWLLKGDRRMIWIPPSMRPRGKDSLFAHKNGLVVFYSKPTDSWNFLRWMDE